jgi:hypothetical protein
VDRVRNLRGVKLFIFIAFHKFWSNRGTGSLNVSNADMRQYKNKYHGTNSFIISSVLLSTSPEMTKCTNTKSYLCSATEIV